MKKLAKFATILAIFTLGTGMSFAQAEGPAGDVTTESFAEHAAMMNMFEIQTAQLALENAQTEGVKEYARKMLEGHQSRQSELQELMEAEEIQVTVPQNFNESYSEMYRNLQNTSGAEFDRAYLKTQQKAHEKALEYLRANVENTGNEELTEWTRNSITAVDDHLAEVKELRGHTLEPAND